jgi:hypothetical protein
MSRNGTEGHRSPESGKAETCVGIALRTFMRRAGAGSIAQRPNEYEQSCRLCGPGTYSEPAHSRKSARALIEELR